jgi:predicted kinase
MPKLYVLVGVPGSGKSTWVASQEWSNTAFISTDKFVDEYANSVGKTYSEVFQSYMPTAMNRMTEEVIEARNAGKNIVWDQTSTSRGARARKLNMLKGYEAIAVVFKTPDQEELSRRLASRPGKNIPDHVMKQMINNFSMPSKNEGFNKIMVI